jgi:hypothetical protein
MFCGPQLAAASVFMNSPIRRASATLVLVCTSVFASAATPAPNELVAGNGLAPVVSDAGIAETLASHAVAPPNRLRPVTGTSPMIAKIMETEPDPKREKKARRAKMLWRVSMAAFVTATALDAATSVGKYESNPLLRSADGKFGMKGMAIKGGIAGAVLAPQIAYRDHRELHSKFAILNFIETGFFAGLAIHNLGIAVPR